MSGSQTIEYVTVQSGVGQVQQFAIDAASAGAIQAELTKVISTAVIEQTSYNPVSATMLTINADGSSNASSLSVPGGANAYALSDYVYVTGTVSSGASLALPSMSVGTDRGFAGYVFGFDGSETVTGGAGLNQLAVTGATTNLTWDPQGGVGLDTIMTGGGNNQFTLDGKNYTVVIASGNNTINAVANIAGGQSYNTISTSGGNNQITLSAGDNTVISGGQDHVLVLDNNNAITMTGSGFVGLRAGSAGNSLLATGGGVVNINGTRQSVTSTGSSQINMGSDASTLSISGALDALITGNANSVTSSASAPMAVFGQNNMIQGGPLGNIFVYGSGNSVVGSGADTILGNGSNNLITDRAGGVIFAAGTNDSIVATGSAFVVLGGAGASDIATLGGTAFGYLEGNTQVDATGSNALLFVSGTNVATVGAGGYAFDFGGSNTVQASGSTVIYGGRGSVDFINTANANALITRGTGSVTAEGGAGSLRAYGGANGNNLLVGGTGSTVLMGEGNGDTLLAGSGTVNALYAGSGNETLSAASALGAVTMTGAANNFASTLMMGGAGSNMFVSDLGAATMIGGANAVLNNFVFGAAGQGATDLISNFRAGTDTLTLNSGVTIVTETRATTGTILQLSDGASVTLSGVTATLTGTMTNNGSVWT